MKKKGRAALWALASLTLCTGLTVLLGILLLPAVIGKAPDRVGEEISGIDYYPDLPENCALLALGEEGEGALIYLDFADISVRVYPFAANAIRQVMGDIPLFDGGYGTARQTQKRLQEAGLLLNGEGSVQMENSLGCSQILKLSMELMNNG
jgi:hypothetical protein